jgi:hypothetical protein
MAMNKFFLQLNQRRRQRSVSLALPDPRTRVA